METLIFCAMVAAVVTADMAPKLHYCSPLLKQWGERKKKEFAEKHHFGKVA